MDGLCIVGHDKNAKLGSGKSSQGIKGYGGCPLWRRRPAFGCSAHEEEEEVVVVHSRDSQCYKRNHDIPLRY